LPLFNNYNHEYCSFALSFSKSGCTYSFSHTQSHSYTQPHSNTVSDYNSFPYACPFSDAYACPSGRIRSTRSERPFHHNDNNSRTPSPFTLSIPSSYSLRSASTNNAYHSDHLHYDN
jgi:hypothetical protein